MPPPAASLPVAGLPIQSVTEIVKAIALQNALSAGAVASTGSSSPALRSLSLYDMLTLDDIKDPDLEQEIRDDACKYGELIKLEIVLENSATTVCAKLTYKNVDDALNAFKALNGRVFDGRKIRAILSAS